MVSRVYTLGYVGIMRHFGVRDAILPSGAKIIVKTMENVTLHPPPPPPPKEAVYAFVTSA